MSDLSVTPINIEDEMQVSYLDYAMSVIIGRALPDIRDGLKPVHRRVLYAMFREGLLHNRKYSKCAGVVGEVLKKYHPHGDAAVYDTLVRMAQPWNMRYPLVDGQGNFGSIDGDSAAAYRYTESRMTRLAEMMLQDIDKETVDFTENFDGSTLEPIVLPTRFPALLVNGSDGIAVGMATKIPPHNLREVINACVHLIDHPETSIEELVLGRPASEERPALQPILPGPDFPTGGLIHGQRDILKAYKEGRGIIQMRATCNTEEDEKTGRSRIVVTEIPYQVNKARLVEKIAELVRDRKVEGISDLRDESNREGIRVVVELKRDVMPEVVLNQLYKHSPLQSSFGIILLSIVQGQPRLLNIKDMLKHFINHRREVTIRRCRYELRKAKERAHILEGLKKALDHIDEIIKTIRSSSSTDEARERLMASFDFSRIQAQAILDLRLQRLTALERDKIIEELKQINMEIERLTNILQNEALLKELIKQELQEIGDDFGDERRCQIAGSLDQISEEDLIAEEDMVVTITNSGYIKRNSLTEYRAQRRGGRGIVGMNTRDEDFVVQLFVASTHDHMLILTNHGRMHQVKVYEIPKASRTALGRPIVNLINLEEGEQPQAVLPIKEFKDGMYLFFATRRGVVKKTELMAYANVAVRSAGLIALKLDDNDELVSTLLTDGEREVILCSRKGQAVRFKEGDVRPMGRSARGVAGIKLGDDDEVVSLVATQEDKNLLTITENGYGKLTPVSEYRITKRNGKGVITIKCNERNGDVASTLEVSEQDQLMVSTDTGRIIRFGADEIRIQGRNTQGVRLFRVDDGERISSVAIVADANDENEDEEGAEGSVDGAVSEIDAEIAAPTQEDAATSGDEQEATLEVSAEGQRDLDEPTE
ncbi:MAG: DNA gyrase subunit A [Myxococcales bacterium]|nr:DNA gyrase subunit A [Myxococcales bacterium]